MIQNVSEGWWDGMKALSAIATPLEVLRVGLTPVTSVVWREEMDVLSRTATPPERLAAEPVQAILLAFGLWIVLVGTFFRQLGRLEAISGTVCAGIVVLVCILVVLGTRSFDFMGRKFAILTSTWIVEFDLQRLCLQGPSLLLVGIALEVSAAIWAVRVKRRCRTIKTPIAQGER